VLGRRIRRGVELAAVASLMRRLRRCVVVGVVVTPGRSIIVGETRTLGAGAQIRASGWIS
jgi:hypothetical protein